MLRTRLSGPRFTVSCAGLYFHGSLQLFNEESLVFLLIRPTAAELLKNKFFTKAKVSVLALSQKREKISIFHTCPSYILFMHSFVSEQ